MSESPSFVGEKLDNNDEKKKDESEADLLKRLEFD
jgi:hypothetical protein